MSEKNISSVNELEDLVKTNEASAVYFSTSQCNVCKVLKPKVIEFLSENFDKITFEYIDLEKIPEAAGKYSVFAVPTIVFFFNGEELFRKSRNFSLSELYQSIERPYSLYFS